MAGEVNLLVEGPTEDILLPAIANVLSPTLRFNFERVLVVNGQGGELPFMARLLGSTGNPTLVVVDNDRGGREVIKQIVQQDNDTISTLMPAIQKLPVPMNRLNECEMEDFFDPQELLEAFNEAFQTIPGYECLPLNFSDYQKEQLHRLSLNLSFGWIETVGSLMKKRTTNSKIASQQEAKIVDKRKLATMAAKYIEDGKMTIPAFCHDIFDKLAVLLGV